MARRLALILALVQFGLPASAVAAPGVFFDPNNPTRSEYAVPLDAERGSASGNDFGSSPGAGNANKFAPAPLFGAGISPGPRRGVRAKPGEAAAGVPSGARNGG